MDFACCEGKLFGLVEVMVGLPREARLPLVAIPPDLGEKISYLGLVEVAMNRSPSKIGHDLLSNTKRLIISRFIFFVFRRTKKQ